MALIDTTNGSSRRYLSNILPQQQGPDFDKPLTLTSAQVYFSRFDLTFSQLQPTSLATPYCDQEST